MIDRQSIEDVYPLSPIQQGILFHTLAVPSHYLNQSWTTVAGKINADTFETAWRRVVARHQVLRTSFHYQDLPHPLQIVHRDVDLPVRRLDWRGRSAADAVTSLDALIADDANRGFELDVAPLMRLALVEGAQRRWSILWSRHHILLDAWSSGILARELRVCYEALAHRREPDLPPAVPFRTYIAWLMAQDRGEAERYWRPRLHDLREATPLPAARRRRLSAHASRRLAHRRHSLSVEWTRRVRQFAARQRLTMSTLVQGAWAVLMARHAAADSVVYGVTVAGRPSSLPHAESIVGPLINTIPARVRVDDPRPVVEWLRDLQREQNDMRQFAYVSLIDLQRWSGITPGRPLFDSIFVFQNAAGGAGSAPSWSSVGKVSQGRSEQSNYPLALVVGLGKTLNLRASFDPDALSEEAIADLLPRLERVLTAMVEHPGRAARRLRVLSDAERRLIRTDTRLADLDTPFQFGS